MKKIEWINDNKMKFESKHKTFNRQCRCISKGNQIGDVVYSGYIRSYNKTECNGQTFESGHLQNYDLNWLVKDMPTFLKDWIKKQGKTESMIGYVFFHRANGHKILDGFVITDTNYIHLKTVYANNKEKTISIIEEAKKYITN